jgi:hypothetical protein
VEEVLTLFKLFFGYFPGGSEENYDIPQTGKPVSELIFLTWNLYSMII